MLISWQLLPKYLTIRLIDNESCKIQLKRKRYIRLDTGYYLNGEKWWRPYGLYTGMPHTTWRSGRWFGLQWNFENDIIFD